MELGTLLSNLKGNSMRELIAHKSCGISTNTSTALTRHAHSLSELKLSFRNDTVDGISSLGECCSLTRLELEFDVPFTLKETHNDTFLAMIEWLGNCKYLKHLTLNECSSAPQILESVLRGQLSLHELCISGKKTPYNMKDARSFHLALAQQSSLQSLILSGDGDGMDPEDTKSLVFGLSELKQLRHLKLMGVFDDFDDECVINVLSGLPRLEEVYLSGCMPGTPITSDAILDTVAQHPALRSVTLLSLSTFTFEGLMDFVSKLPPKREGFEFSVQSAHTTNLLGEEEIAMIQTMLWDKIGGRFDYTPIRGE